MIYIVGYQWDINGIYPLVICYIAIEHGHRNSGFSIEHGDLNHSYVKVYQRVTSSL